MYPQLLKRQGIEEIEELARFMNREVNEIINLIEKDPNTIRAAIKEKKANGVDEERRLPFKEAA